mmetsp:Transcript_9346/g.21702  ORF Transcript_9346/g.21702 Transcript_9346/m.21702 type:complete len:256 (-) Transcript_9346:80-847(-)
MHRALLGRLILKEKLQLLDALAIATGIVGVILVARPESLFGISEPESKHDLPYLPGEYVVLLGAVFAGSVVVLIRLIQKRGNAHPAVLAHAYACVSMLISPLGLLLPGQTPRFANLTSPATTWMLCVLIGVLAVPNQLLVNAGMMRTPAALGAMMRLIDVPTAFVLQVSLFAEIPLASSVGGAGLIILCTVGTAMRKWMASDTSRIEQRVKLANLQSLIDLRTQRTHSGRSFGRLQEIQIAPVCSPSCKDCVAAC